MKTSKEMQLKILDKMRDNVESDFPLFSGVQCFEYGRWSDEEASELLFDDLKYRIKPETITISGVEIPKPLDREEVEKISIGRMSRVYSVSHKKALCGVLTPEVVLAYGYRLVYRTEEEAIEASKALFGIKE